MAVATVSSETSRQMGSTAVRSEMKMGAKREVHGTIAIRCALGTNRRRRRTATGPTPGRRDLPAASSPPTMADVAGA